MAGWLDFLQIAAPIAMRAMGAAAAAGDYAEMERLRQEAIKELNIPLPDLNELMTQMGPSHVGDVKADPRYSGAADEALGGLKDLSTTGFSAQDRAGYDRAGLEAANTYSGMMGANQQLRASRGQLGGGADTAGQFAAASAGADRAAHSGLEVASKGADRRYAALGAYGSMAERLKAADLSQKDLAAESQDRIDKFNTEGKRYAPQQNFENRLGLAKVKYGAGQTAGTQKQQQGQQTEGTYADVGEGISRGAGAISQGQEWDKFLKKKYG